MPSTILTHSPEFPAQSHSFRNRVKDLNTSVGLKKQLMNKRMKLIQNDESLHFRVSLSSVN